MTTPRKPSSFVGDVEKPHPTSSDCFGDEAQAMPVRLGDLWSEFVHAAEETRDPDAPNRLGYSVPILDDMKGILQWD
jgi:hypothetical protein